MYQLGNSEEDPQLKNPTEFIEKIKIILEDTCYYDVVLYIK